MGKREQTRNTLHQAIQYTSIQMHRRRQTRRTQAQATENQVAMRAAPRTRLPRTTSVITDRCAQLSRRQRTLHKLNSPDAGRVKRQCQRSPVRHLGLLQPTIAARDMATAGTLNVHCPGSFKKLNKLTLR